MTEKIVKGTENLFWKYPLTPIEVLEGNTLGPSRRRLQRDYEKL